MENKKMLLPRSQTRWQVYPSDDEVLLVKMLSKYACVDKDVYMIRIMINYFAEHQDTQLDLVNYARQFVRPRTGGRPARKNISIAKSNAIISQDIIEHVNYYLSVIQNMKNIDE